MSRWPDRKIIRGNSYTWLEQFTQDGVAKNMTGLSGFFRMLSADGVTLVERDTDDATEFTWDVQASGSGQWDWTIAQTEALTVGVYMGEIFESDTGPVTERSKANEDERCFVITVVDPETGSL